MKYRHLISLFAGLCATTSFATETALSSTSTTHPLWLQNQPGFFRFSYDNIKMPNHIQNMGLLGLNYFADFNSYLYGGVGAYGAVTGSQGGLFTLGLGGGLHHELFHHLWGDVGMYAGGGGGRSSLVGGGLMLRPNVGLQYDFRWLRLGVHYSYIDFPDGQIHGSSVGADFDIPLDFYYVPYRDVGCALFNFNDLHLCNGDYLDFKHNDLAILAQEYRQHAGTKNVEGNVQDGQMGLVGAELDHYFSEHAFWMLKSSGAFSGSTNGYMDVLGGVGYHVPLGCHGFALVPEFGLGVGGGGNVDTGGGVLVEPLLAFEVPFSHSVAGRVGGGYIWAPDGQLKATLLEAELLYHLDLASASATPVYDSHEYYTQGWRIQIFNQTYVHPQRVSESTTSPDNLIVLQFDQLFTPNFFFSYQAAAAYAGVHAGGFATGMIGPGLQTLELFHHHLQLFGEFLVGAGGGGGLQIGGGALVEPVVGAHVIVTDGVGLQASVGEVKSVQSTLSTPVVNLGVTIRFGMLNKE